MLYQIKLEDYNTSIFKNVICTESYIPYNLLGNIKYIIK